MEVKSPTLPEHASTCFHQTLYVSGTGLSITAPHGRGSVEEAQRTPKRRTKAERKNRCTLPVIDRGKCETNSLTTELNIMVSEILTRFGINRQRIPKMTGCGQRSLSGPRVLGIAITLLAGLVRCADTPVAGVPNLALSGDFLTDAAKASLP
jgi:hypothetical protein